MSYPQSILSLLNQYKQNSAFQELHWEGTMADYLEIVRQRPQVLQNAFQRIYQMILAAGTEEYSENKEKLARYKFFSDPMNEGKDAVYGLEKPLMHLVHIFKSAARHYGTERRVILLHGPVGSAKSTIVRLLKKGLEAYSRTPEGAIYTFAWHLPGPDSKETVEPCPMHEEPLHLFPLEIRAPFLRELNTQLNGFPAVSDGELCPFCRFTFRNLMQQNAGDLEKVLNHVRVYRLVLSEQDRVGIGTFQPKDEKNQDSRPDRGYQLPQNRPLWL